MTGRAPRPSWALALSSCLGLAACGAAEPSDRELQREQAAIYGGALVGDGNWENVVALSTCTAVLVAPTLVVYAAHCGTSFYEVALGSDVSAPFERAAVARCRAHPDAALGNGRDVAYCLLSEPVLDVPALKLPVDAELAAVQAGTAVRQVGYGVDRDGGLFGTKRESTGVVLTVGDDIVIAGVESGTCTGDSGGPALIQADSFTPASPPEWRVLGLLSAGTSFDCGVSTDHYSNLHDVRHWLEFDSGVALTATVPEPAAPPPEAPASAPTCALSPARSRDGAALGLAGYVVVALALLRRHALWSTSPTR
jgi:V8-like Glu-specific endopeptidase